MSRLTDLAKIVQKGKTNSAIAPLSKGIDKHELHVLTFWPNMT